MSESKQQGRGLHPYTVMGIILVAMFIVGIAACQSSGARGAEGAPPPGGQGAGAGRGAPPPFPGNRPGAAGGLSARRGGSSVLEVEGQFLEAELSADGSSSIAVVLRGGSTWTGSINADKAAKAASLSLDASSRWIVTADSCLTSLAARLGPDGRAILGIEGNGHAVRYDSKANPWLGGGTYSLEKGGSLLPY